VCPPERNVGEKGPPGWDPSGDESLSHVVVDEAEEAVVFVSSLAMLLLRGVKMELLVVVALERRRKGMLGSMKVENFHGVLRACEVCVG
jgi:hypothetical protein